MVDPKEAMKGSVLFEQGSHRVVWLGWDEKTASGAVQTNQYLIVDGERGMLLDPGGVHLFSHVVAALSGFISIDRIDTILFSHQDPDVSSGITLWLGVTPATIHISELWMRFLPHFGIVNMKRLSPIPDAGKNVPFGSGTVACVPAHFLHSPGNFSFHDSQSRILFSGDIGAAVFPEGKEYLFVEDFQAHVPLMEGFHRRYMVSRKACAQWVSRVRKLPRFMIAPQHGAIFPEAQADRFLSWIEGLECGIDLFRD